MSKYSGRLVNLGIAKEATRGTFVAPTYLVPRVGLTFDDKIVQARSEAGLGVLADSEEAFVTTKYAQGDLDGEVRDKSFGLFLLAMLGSVSTAGPTDSTYTHSFSVSNANQHQSLAFLVSDSNTSEAYKLVMLDSLGITAELDQVVKYSASFMAKKGNNTTASQASLVAENKFTKKHVAVKIASALSGLTAATALSIKSLSLNINKNLVLDDVLGTAEPEDILNQSLSIEGEITLSYEDETYKNLMRDGTARAMEIKLVNSDVFAGGSTNPALTLRFPNVDFFDWSPDYALDSIAQQTVSFKMSYLNTGTEIISTCELVNAVTEY